jgi:N-methylhydantoinase A
VHFADGGWADTPVLDRGALATGAELRGPCVVEGVDTTVVVPPGTSGTVSETGDIVISLR